MLNQKLRVLIGQIEEKHKRNLKILSSTDELLEKMKKKATCAEVGVFKGAGAKKIIEITNPARLHLIDVYWKRYGKNFPDWGEYTDWGKLETKEVYEEAVKNVLEAHKKGVAIFHVGYSWKILKTFSNSYFDWVYIDSAHIYSDSWRELKILKDKVRENGFIAGHDYCAKFEGVVLAVNRFCSKYDYELIFLTDEEFPSWAIRKIV